MRGLVEWFTRNPVAANLLMLLLMLMVTVLPIKMMLVLMKLVLLKTKDAHGLIQMVTVFLTKMINVQISLVQ